MIVEGETSFNKIICISFDCDKDEDMERIPSLLDFLNNKNIKSSFAVFGDLAKKYPTIIKRMIDTDHEIINHSFSHPGNFSLLGKNEMKKEIELFQKFMVEKFNYRPKGFRVPHLMRKYREDLFCILKSLRLYDSSYIGRGILEINNVIEIPLTSCPDHPQVCFDYWHHFQLPLIKCTYKKFLFLWNYLLKKEFLINIFLDPHLITDNFLDEMIVRGTNSFKFYKLEDIINLFSDNNTQVNKSFT